MLVVECASCKLPYAELNVLDVPAHIRQGRIPSVSLASPENAKLLVLIDRCLVVDPAHRPRAAEVRAATQWDELN